MDGPGPEPKRQRLDYNASQRPPAQQLPMPHPHNHPNTIPPPSHTYPPIQQPPPPPSPYLPDPTGPHAYVQEHFGTNTPLRDQRFPPEPDFSRRSSVSAVARSPNGHHQYPPGRSLSQHNPASHYPIEHGGYSSHEAPPNGNPHHGLQMHAYEYNHSQSAAGSPYAIPYSIQQYGQTGARPPKKGNRATQACDICRTRKAKCDEGRPECGFCVENNMRCNYQSVAPAKADRANQQIIEQLSSQKEEMKSLKEDWGTRFDKIEQLISKLGGARCMAIENPEAKVPTLKMESSGDLKGPVVPTLTGSVTVDPGAADTSPSSSFGNLGTDSAGSDLTRTNAIYIEHNTAAQKLFRWRSIRALLSQSSKLDFSPQTEKYVMDFERNKGVLRVYGRGRQKRESGDLSPKSVHTDSPANSHVSGPSDDTVTTSSPVSSPENLWGTGFVPTAGESRATSDVGGLGPDNTLKLDPKTITRLIRSYIDNIHIMHPFLDERALTRQVELFKRRYNPHDYSSSKGSFAVPINTNLDAVQNSYAVLNIPSKRKHSDGCYHGPGDSSLAPSPMPKIFLERSPETAMILLVLALGKICECTTPLPGPVPETAKDFLNPFTHPYSPTGGRIDSPPPYPQPMRQSPSSQSTTSTSAPSPMSASRFTTSSPKSSVGEMPGMRNVDVIPGLAYYAQATDILGNIAGLHELIFAQCCLLAGLYAGQLANTLESLTWIQTASRTCRFLVQEELWGQVKEPEKDLTKLAFWSSLQLESDILAELDLPRSGIQDIEGVEYPNGTVAQESSVHGDSADSERSTVMKYYSFQLHMRKYLNDMQKDLYPKKNPSPAVQSFNFLTLFNDMIWNWRRSLPEPLQWDETQGPARNINAARLRGKFYGAQYIIHRPFLHAALDYDLETPDIQSPQNPSVQNNGSSLPPIGPDPQPGSMGPPRGTAEHERYRRSETIKLAVRCIRAAEQSTVAFDGVLAYRRMVVTNIMGTAHAQFGNMLVLSAAYKSKTLGEYVDATKLNHLFHRTINLLGSLAPISRTLEKDCFILQCLRKVVFEGGDVPATSFSSE